MNLHFPQTPIYYECTLPFNIFLKLKEIIKYEENTGIKANSHLAGNIEEEYNVVKNDKDLVSYLEKQATEFFISINQNRVDLSIPDLKLNSFWINKQKKYEFNPIHNHNGFISFVCWVQIPYDLNDELNLDNCKNSNTPSNSLFEFIYADNFGQVTQHKIMVDKTYEGKCLFFDSRLNHQVYPFYTSDDCRISVSGNFVVKERKLKKISYN